jgi:hypothetical protein
LKELRITVHNYNLETNEEFMITSEVLYNERSKIYPKSGHPPPHPKVRPRITIKKEYGIIPIAGEIKKSSSQQ